MPTITAPTPLQRDRLINALKWQAVADALGDPFEFQAKPKPSHLEYLIKGDDPLYITDDTQMTLFGFEAILDKALADPQTDELDYLTEVRQAYLRWYTTQIEPEPNPTASGLAAIPSLYQRRAPGMTCMAALSKLNSKPQLNNSKGCGGVMRALPFVLMPSDLLAITSTLLTHHHPEAVKVAKEHYIYARQLFVDQIPTPSKKEWEQLFADGGWQAQSCLDIAIYSLEHSKADPLKMLQLSILHAGDSDSTAAVAGALFGLAYPDITPAAFYSRLVERTAIDCIVEKIERFACHCRVSFGN